MSDPIHPLLPPQQRDPRNWGYFVLGMITTLLAMSLGLMAVRAYEHWGGAVPEPMRSQQEREAIDEGLIDEAWQIIRKDFYDALPSQKTRTYGAIRGSMATLEDPYTYFIEPEPAGREKEHLQGKFGGIGAYLNLNQQQEVELSPMVDRPAAQAGVRKGDILLAVDGDSLSTPINLDDVVDKLRGEVGSKVRLTIRRQTGQVQITVTRAEIELPSVSWHAMPEAAGVGYIHIEHFSGLTEQEFMQALTDLLEKDAARALIIDLRGNPGGLVDAAVAVADHFLDKGIVLRERHADGSEKVYKASMGVSIAAETRVIVLVDANTASAAEILAGALQDRGRATLIGEKTYGKGCIQRIHPLSDGSAVHVTFAKWFTPNKRAIDGVGLEPDIAVESQAEIDTYVQKALAVLETK